MQAILITVYFAIFNVLTRNYIVKFRRKFSPILDNGEIANSF